jgi:hypothetical protein
VPKPTSSRDDNPSLAASCAAGPVPPAPLPEAVLPEELLLERLVELLPLELLLELVLPLELLLIEEAAALAALALLPETEDPAAVDAVSLPPQPVSAAQMMNITACSGLVE